MDLWSDNRSFFVNLCGAESSASADPLTGFQTTTDRNSWDSHVYGFDGTTRLEWIDWWSGSPSSQLWKYGEQTFCRSCVWRVDWEWTADVRVNRSNITDFPGHTRSPIRRQRETQLRRDGVRPPTGSTGVFWSCRRHSNPSRGKFYTQQTKRVGWARLMASNWRTIDFRRRPRCRVPAYSLQPGTRHPACWIVSIMCEAAVKHYNWCASPAGRSSHRRPYVIGFITPASAAWRQINSAVQSD